MASTRNVGDLDAGLRALLAVSLIGLGLLQFDGLKGEPLGIAVALTSLLPLSMVVTRRCFVFRWFGWSSVPKAEREG
jgi:hypothetical protein